MMMQPTRVLPSNASPLHEVDSGHESRVLQEHSGNRQHHDYSYDEHHEQKYPSVLLTENSYYAGPQLPHHPAQVYQQTNLQRHHRHYGQARYRPADEHARMRRAQKEAEAIYRRFRDSDGYTKYRQRQQRDDKVGTEQKWPDCLELAFFQALVMWPPMGRHKHTHKDKLRGRNELISDYILEKTGVRRDRKQVSSHIQVLKPFTRGDPGIMKYFSTDERGAHHRGHAERRQPSRYPVMAPPASMCNGRPPFPRVETRDWTNSRVPPPTFEPLSFEMFVQQKDMPNVMRRLHTYTASIAQPNSPDENLHDWPTVSSAYPQLAKLHSERPLNCNIVAAQASIALTTETWKDQKNVELGISFSCRSHHLPVDAKISCWNRFYKDGSYVNDGCRPDEVQLLQNEQGRMEAQVKFGSKFWASNLACLATRLRNGIDPMTGSSNSREEVRRLIDGITATQEIVAQTEHGGAETLLVIFWKFKLSSGSQGQASWHRLLLPSVSAAHYNESSQDESLDSFMYNLPYDYASPSQQIQPGLQSPFEYEQDSSSGSALTSGTWPASLDDGINTAPANAVDFTGDNSLDFTGGSINVSYDDTNFDFSNFDSTAFSLDTAGDFVTDPILEQYSQPDYSTQYCDSYANSFDTQQSISASDASFAISAMDSQSQNVFEGFGEPYGHSFSVGNESQAYGGAGEEMIKEEDPLAALADASYMVSGALTREEHRSQE